MQSCVHGKVPSRAAPSGSSLSTCSQSNAGSRGHHAAHHHVPVPQRNVQVRSTQAGGEIQPSFPSVLPTSVLPVQPPTRPRADIPQQSLSQAALTAEREPSNTVQLERPTTIISPLPEVAKSKLTLTWAGAGLYFFWQLGAVKLLLEKFDLRTVPFAGASGGALASVLAACHCDPEYVLETAYELSLEHQIWERPLGLAGEAGRAGLGRTWTVPAADLFMINGF